MILIISFNILSINEIMTNEANPGNTETSNK